MTAHDSSGDEGNPSDPVTAGAGAGAPAGTTTAGPAASADVTVDDNTFTAATVDVQPGATVTWHWAPGSSTHTVTADPGQAEAFDVTRSTGTFAHTFTREGRFTYLCRRHSRMQGVVIVRRPSATPDTTAPATPAGLTADAGDRSVALDWADVDAPDLAGYRVERQNLDGSWTTVGETTASAYTAAGLTNGAAYAYRVTAFDLAGNVSAPSATVTATPAATAAPTERTVTIGDYAYGPSDIVVDRGDTVVWSWTGPDVNHTVTSAPGSAQPFESHPGVADGAVTGAPAGGYRHTFTSTGTFSYLCRVHPDMTATVTVVEAGASATTAKTVAVLPAPAPARASDAPAAVDHPVTVAQYRYSPAALTVEQGDSVTWRWTGEDKNHSVTVKPGQGESFDSHDGLKLSQIRTAPAGGRFTHTFMRQGTFAYYCRLHPDMTGRVTVVARDADAAPLRVALRRASLSGGRLVARFTLSAPATVRAELRRGDRTLRTWRLAGRRGLNERRLRLPRAARRTGRYRLLLSASGAAPIAATVRRR